MCAAIVWMVMLAGTVLRVIAQLKYRRTDRLSELASRYRQEYYLPLGWRLYKLGTMCMLVGAVVGSLLIWLTLGH